MAKKPFPNLSHKATKLSKIVRMKLSIKKLSVFIVRKVRPVPTQEPAKNSFLIIAQ
jgi:hypothetical protein